MKSFFQFILRLSVAFVTTVSIWLFSFFLFNQTFWLSSLFALGSGTIIFIIIKQISHTRMLKEYGLSRREYKFISRNLKEAKHKISRVQRSLRHMKKFEMLKETLEMVRTARKIYSNTKKEPKRFFMAEEFYYNHLDSVVELTEKYAYLSSQPAKTQEMKTSLLETEQMLRQVGNTVKMDLHHMLKDDIDTLHFELDVAKHTLSKGKNERSAFNERTK